MTLNNPIIIILNFDADRINLFKVSCSPPRHLCCFHRRSSPPLGSSCPVSAGSGPAGCAVPRSVASASG